MSEEVRRAFWWAFEKYKFRVGFCCGAISVSLLHIIIRLAPSM